MQYYIIMYSQNDLYWELEDFKRRFIIKNSLKKFVELEY